MVLTVSNDDDGLTDTFFLGEAMGSHLDGTGNVGTLSSHHRRVDGRQEHLGRHIVTGNRQLHKGIASKDNQSYLVVGEVVHQVLNHHLGTIQTTG